MSDNQVTTSDNHALVREAVASRLKTAEATLDMIATPKPEGLLHMPLRRNLLDGARSDVKLAKQILCLHKMVLGQEMHQTLLDQANIMESRVNTTNLQPHLKPVPQEIS